MREFTNIGVDKNTDISLYICDEIRSYTATGVQASQMWRRVVWEIRHCIPEELVVIIHSLETSNLIM
jgi:hypothetical protein